jgi:hypothetical protein
MAQFTEFRDRSFKAGADLRTKQYYFVAVDPANQNQVVVATDPTDPATIGILKNAPNLGEAADVVLCGGQGTMKVCAFDNSIGIGDEVSLETADGRAVADTSSGDYIFGIALEASGAQNDIIEVLLCRYQYP